MDVCVTGFTALGSVCHLSINELLNAFYTWYQGKFGCLQRPWLQVQLPKDPYYNHVCPLLKQDAGVFYDMAMVHQVLEVRSGSMEHLIPYLTVSFFLVMINEDISILLLWDTVIFCAGH
jgi:hypothetical protein